jgi:hypothetical protein
MQLFVPQTLSIFLTTLSKDDLIELQIQIQSFNLSNFGTPAVVQPIKLAFLCSKKDLKDEVPADSDSESGCGLTMTMDLTLPLLLMLQT